MLTTWLAITAEVGFVFNEKTTGLELIRRGVTVSLEFSVPKILMQVGEIVWSWGFTPQVFMQSSRVANLFPLAPQPPKMKQSQVSVSGL